MGGPGSESSMDPPNHKSCTLFVSCVSCVHTCVGSPLPRRSRRRRLSPRAWVVGPCLWRPARRRRRPRRVPRLWPAVSGCRRPCRPHLPHSYGRHRRCRRRSSLPGLRRCLRHAPSSSAACQAKRGRRSPCSRRSSAVWPRFGTVPPVPRRAAGASTSAPGLRRRVTPAPGAPHPPSAGVPLCPGPPCPSLP